MKNHSRTGAAVQLDDIQLDKPVDYPVAIHWTATGSLRSDSGALAHDLVDPLEKKLAVIGKLVYSTLTLHPCKDAILNEVGAVGVEVVVGVGVEGDVLLLALTILAVHRLLKAVVLTPIGVGFLDTLCMVRDGEEELSPGEFTKLVGSIEDCAISLRSLRANIEDIAFGVAVGVRVDLGVPEAESSIGLLLLGLKGAKLPPVRELNLGRDDISDELYLALDLEAGENCTVSMGLNSLVEGSDGLEDEGVGRVGSNHSFISFFEVNYLFHSGTIII